MCQGEDVISWASVLWCIREVSTTNQYSIDTVDRKNARLRIQLGDGNKQAIIGSFLKPARFSRFEKVMLFWVVGLVLLRKLYRHL